MLFTYLFFLLSLTQNLAKLPIGKIFNKDQSIEVNLHSDKDNWTQARVEFIEHPDGGPARRSTGFSLGYKNDKAVERQMRDNEHDKLVDEDGTVWYGCICVMGKHVYYITAEQRRARVIADRMALENELKQAEKEQQVTQPVAIAVAA